MRYTYKVKLITDLLDAQAQRQEAYTNTIKARVEYKLKEIDYLKATGKLF